MKIYQYNFLLLFFIISLNLQACDFYSKCLAPKSSNDFDDVLLQSFNKDYVLAQRKEINPFEYSKNDKEIFIIKSGNISNEDIQLNQSNVVGSFDFVHCIAGILYWEVEGKGYVYLIHAYPFEWEKVIQVINEKYQYVKKLNGKNIQPIIHTSKWSFYSKNGTPLYSDELQNDMKVLLKDSDKQEIHEYSNVVVNSKGVLIYFPTTPEKNRYLLWKNNKIYIKSENKLKLDQKFSNTPFLLKNIFLSPNSA